MASAKECGSFAQGPMSKPVPVFCLLLRVSLDYAQPITGQITEVTCPVIVQAQPELTPSKRRKKGPGVKSIVKIFLPKATLTVPPFL